MAVSKTPTESEEKSAASIERILTWAARDLKPTEIDELSKLSLEGLEQKLKSLIHKQRARAQRLGYLSVSSSDVKILAQRFRDRFG